MQKQKENKNLENLEEKLAQPFLTPLLFPLIYCQITDVLNWISCYSINKYIYKEHPLINLHLYIYIDFINQVEYCDQTLGNSSPTSMIGIILHNIWHLLSNWAQHRIIVQLAVWLPPSLRIAGCGPDSEVFWTHHESGLACTESGLYALLHQTVIEFCFLMMSK